MTLPQLDVRLDRIEHNAAVLVSRLRTLGISVTGVTKPRSTDELGGVGAVMVQ